MVKNIIHALTLTAAGILIGCGSGGENDTDTVTDTDLSGTSQLNPDLDTPDTSGAPGGDVTSIAGLWDGSMIAGDTEDVIYWYIDPVGLLSRYDFQQDGTTTASGENCYLVSDPITLTPEGDDDYSLDDVALTAVVSDDAIAITFLEADANDFNENGDLEETPSLTWTRLVSPVLEDLNPCTTSSDDDTVQN